MNKDNINKKAKKAKQINEGEVRNNALGGLAKAIQNKHKEVNKIQYLSCKIFNYGERGSGFTIKGEPQDFNKLRDECLQNEILFEDPYFPANSYSLYKLKLDDANVVWKRPSDISNNPQFQVDDFTRFDINQGDLGDCWLLAALASITMYKNVFHQVVPEDQSFTDKYAGIFHFRFWQYGRWIDIVVDDRLPTVNGKLRYVQSTSKNEFWTALLEKAYAKLNGSYVSLESGHASEALTDFTGGITEIIKLTNNCTNEIFALMLKSYERNSLMVCYAKMNPDVKEFVDPAGIIHGHPYTVTSVKSCKGDLPEAEGNISLIRLRNQWKNDIEWNGPFSDGSPEWRHIPENLKKEIGLVFEADGEFWMPFQHFCKYFDTLTICNLTPDSFSTEDIQKDSKKRWYTNIFEGEWVKGVTAGGCANFSATFYKNPQYRIILPQPDDEDGKVCTVIIFIIQKHSRLQNIDVLPIGFGLYAISHTDKLPKPLDKEFFSSNYNLNGKNGYEQHRQIACRFKLLPGTYCIVPSTFFPNAEREFIIQVFTPKKCEMEENDEELNMEKEKMEEACCESSAELEKYGTKEYFLQLAGEDKEIDWMELKELLDHTMKAELSADGFSKDICRSMIAMMDYDYSGKLDYDEFKILWADIYIWKGIYKTYEENNHLPGRELREVLRGAGFRLNNHILNIIEHRYGDQDGNITFDDFIMCLVRLKTTFETFKFKDQNNTNIATFTLEEWLEKTVYS